MFFPPRVVRQLFFSPVPTSYFHITSHWTQISFQETSLQVLNPPPPTLSQRLFGDCDKTLVPPRVTSPASPATIPTLDFTSFTTDQQSIWSSTPLTQPASAQIYQHNFDQDFQLFNTPPQAPYNPPSRGQAIPRIAPNHQTSFLPANRLSPATVSQRPLQSTNTGYTHSPNNYRSLTNPNAKLLQLQRMIARQNQNRTRPPVPIFGTANAPQPRHRASDPIQYNQASTMNVFDTLDFHGGSFGDASLDFIETSMFDSPQTAHPATISPTELWNDEAVMSAPPSSTFPNLTTPGSEFLESPDISSGLNTDSLFDGMLDSELDLTRLSNLPSLFPDAQQDHYDSQPSIVHNASFESISDLNAYQPVSASVKASPMVRQKSSPGRPPIVHDRKASLSAGITKANQKSRKDLPDIVIENEDDKETAKRKKNTAAARKSRQRKQETLGAMSAEISRLRAIIEAMGGDPDLEFSSP